MKEKPPVENAVLPHTETKKLEYMPFSIKLIPLLEMVQRRPVLFLILN